MLQRDGYPAGLPCFIVTSQPDAEAAARFYCDLFGWTAEEQMAADAPGHYFAARLDGRGVAGISSQSAGAAPIAGWSTYIAVDDADDIAEKVRAAGGSVPSEPLDVFDAGRMAVWADPQGAPFSLWQAARHIGAQVVNAPGSWNWSDLHTTDLGAAKDFYGAVFGWGSSDLEFGSSRATMWRRRPGSCDVLDQHLHAARVRRPRRGSGVRR